MPPVVAPLLVPAEAPAELVAPVPPEPLAEPEDPPVVASLLAGGELEEHAAERVSGAAQTAASQRRVEVRSCERAVGAGAMCTILEVNCGASVESLQIGEASWALLRHALGVPVFIWSPMDTAEKRSHRVLVIEDDSAMAGTIVQGLKRAGFEVSLAVDGATGLAAIVRGEHEAIVLDLLLPELTGFEVLERSQGKARAPIFVLTARTELPDRLKCFALGACDFLPKPFWMEELVARLHARLSPRVALPARVVAWGEARVDLDGRVVSVAGRPIMLTRNELDLLAYLLERPGRAVSREQLAERALDPLREGDPRTVDSHMARVRKKLGPEAAAALVTVWGVGYRFEPRSEEAP